jgi:thiosulfate reductase cytochrome b subunit
MIYHYPFYIRLWHMLNALLMGVLIITGISMEFSDTDAALISFPLSIVLHNSCGIGLTASYLLFVLGNILSGNGKHYRIRWKGLRQRVLAQLRYYGRDCFRGDPPPYPVTRKTKFNPLQALSYALSMYLGLPLVVVTGWGLLFPETLVDKLFGVNGLILTVVVHITVGFLLSIFMIIHIYMCTIGMHPLGNFRAILHGWHPAE